MKSPRGQVTTFYSFKGGVGRTMALANVAYLAANQGDRVLVMDWDLEAPGLWYYFRGLVEVEQINLYRDAPGVLNVLWDWQRRVSRIEDVRESRALRDDFESGEPFEKCVLPILNLEAPASGRIDYIAAGSETVLAEEPMLYGDALSSFPWSQFNDGMAGNSLIEMWRQWAKRNYDLILIDSRTGFADVAGLCTMAFPDDVVLCMVMNRQNIDGTARVAAEIRRTRQNDVNLHVAPMRVARVGGAEFDNATARARSMLTRVGGMTDAAVVRDFDQLSIPSADGVPFYESLAPFASASSTFDVLTLAYCRMASELTGVDIKPPAIKDAFRERVRRRQDPRTATLEYLGKLSQLEPARAFIELDGLIDSAIASNNDQASLSVEYVDALINAAFSIDKSTVDTEAQTAVQRLVEFARSLYHQDSSLWMATYLSVLTRTVNETGMDLLGSASDHLAIYDEIDELLIGDDRLATLVLRLFYKRRAAFLRYMTSSDDEVPLQAAGEGLQLADHIRPLVDEGSDQYLEVLSGQAELNLLIADVAMRSARLQDAANWYSAVCEIELPPEGTDRLYAEELRSHIAQAHMRLALLGDDVIAASDAAVHAMTSLNISSGSTVGSYRRLAELSRLFASREVSVNLSTAFVDHFDNMLPRALRTLRVGFAPIRSDFFLDLLESLALLANKLVVDSPAATLVLTTAAIDCLEAATTRRKKVIGLDSARLRRVIDQLRDLIAKGAGSEAVLANMADQFLATQEPLASVQRSEP